MIPLVTVADWFKMLLWAGAFGALGGFAYELLQPRGKDESGWLELPGPRPGHYDLGFVAAVIVGAVAAMAVMYVLAPIKEVTVPVSTGGTTVQVQYELVKLLALSLIVGSAGGSFLKSLQARVLAAMKDQQTGDTAAAGKQVAANTAAASAAAAETAVTESVAQLSNELQRVVNDAANCVPGVAAKVIRDHWDILGTEVDRSRLILEPTSSPDELARQVKALTQQAAARAREIVEEQTKLLVEQGQKVIDAVARA